MRKECGRGGGRGGGERGGKEVEVVGEERSCSYVC